MRNTSKIKDLTGQKFNLLTVIGIAQRNPLMWKCKCDCGNITSVRTSNHKRGLVKSCGCLHKKGNPIHNQSNTRVYRIYAKILRRCFVPEDPAYVNYGGRGITMCEEWRNSFIAFSDWAYSNGYSDDLSIDRINNDGNYCPENCKWSNRTEQACNRRSTKFYTINGETKTLSEWCRCLEMPYKTVCRRLALGWTFEQAIAYKNDARIFKRRKESS